MITRKQALSWFLFFLILITACKAIYPETKSGPGVLPTASLPAVQAAPSTATPLPPSPLSPTSTETTPAVETAAPTAVVPTSAVPTAVAATTVGTTAAATPEPGSGQVSDAGVRTCDFVPGVSTPAVMPPEVLVAATPTPFATPTLPASSPVEASVKEQQLKTFQQVWDRVNQDYVYRDFNGRDWKAIGEKYRKLIEQGLAQEDFYSAMNNMIAELGDEHSAFLSPKDVQDMAKAMLGQNDFVGIGGYTDISIPGRLVIYSVIPNSPAEEAELKPHDSILQVDGGPVLDANRLPRTLGLEGTAVTITVKTPGQPPRDLKLVRRHITSQPQVDACLMPGTRIGYIRWVTYTDTTVPSQTIAILKKMTADQPLDGLILDNRYNSGGLIDVLQSLLGLFTKGKQGDFLNAQNAAPLNITPRDLNGSQTVPLVVLTGPNTQSAAELASGMLQTTRRARLVGESTGGHVEELLSFDLVDGSRLNLAVRTFQPVGLPNNAWENKGVAPDVLVPERWDLFNEASDPAIAEAVDLLMGK